MEPTGRSRCHFPFGFEKPSPLYPWLCAVAATVELVMRSSAGEERGYRRRGYGGERRWISVYKRVPSLVSRFAPS